MCDGHEPGADGGGRIWVSHQSDDGKYLIMGNGTRAFAVAAEQPEQDNPLRTAEMTLEDDYGMIDGVINNGRRGGRIGKSPGVCRADNAGEAFHP